MGGIKDFRHLDVWRKAHSLVLDVYKCTSSMPTEEKYGLCSQMRRSAVSIPANIAEGFKREGQNDKARFYNIAQGSLEELRYYFILIRDLGHRIEILDLEDRLDHIGRMLTNLIRSVRQ